MFNTLKKWIKKAYNALKKRIQQDDTKSTTTGGKTSDTRKNNTFYTNNTNTKMRTGHIAAPMHHVKTVPSGNASNKDTTENTATSVKQPNKSIRHKTAKINRHRPNKAIELEKYFDNDDTAADKIEFTKSKQDAWLMSVVAELNAADRAKTQAQATAHRETRKFVESIKRKNPTIANGWTRRDINQYERKRGIEENIIELWEEYFDDAECNPFITNHVTNHFIERYEGADTAAAMRAYEKQKRCRKNINNIFEKQKTK